MFSENSLYQILRLKGHTGGFQTRWRKTLCSSVNPTNLFRLYDWLSWLWIENVFWIESHGRPRWRQLFVRHSAPSKWQSGGSWRHHHFHIRVKNYNLTSNLFVGSWCKKLIQYSITQFRPCLKIIHLKIQWKFLKIRNSSNSSNLK